MYETELDDAVEDILASGNTGVVLSIAQACRRLGAKQSHFFVVSFQLVRFSQQYMNLPIFQALMKSFHCYEPSTRQEKVAPLLVHMLTYEVLEAKAEDDAPPPVHLHGSLLLQEMLAFNKPIKVANSLLGMKKQKLRMLLSDPRGCHITDAFMASATVGEKSRDALVKALSVSGTIAYISNIHNPVI